MPASHPRVATVSHHEVDIDSAAARGMAMWSHTATYQNPCRSAALAIAASSAAPADASHGSA